MEDGEGRRLVLKRTANDRFFCRCPFRGGWITSAETVIKEAQIEIPHVAAKHNT
jgi:hypothetical protein